MSDPKFMNFASELESSKLPVCVFTKVFLRVTRLDLVRKKWMVGISDLCKREYQKYWTWVELGKRGVPVGVGHLG